MLKRVLIAAAIMIATPGFLFSQDIFFSFANDASQGAASGEVGSTGSAYIFSSPTFAFDAADLSFSSSDGGVLAITGGEGIDAVFNAVGKTKFDSSAVTVGSETSGTWFAVNVAQNGVNPALGPLFDPGFVADVGVLLARVDYSVVGAGDATLSLAQTPNGKGVISLPDTFLQPTFGSATLTGTGGTAVPEPSSAMLLVLASVGLVSRRRKA